LGVDVQAEDVLAAIGISFADDAAWLEITPPPNSAVENFQVMVRAHDLGTTTRYGKTPVNHQLPPLPSERHGKREERT
jgi:hypothetical protein